MAAGHRHNRATPCHSCRGGPAGDGKQVWITHRACLCVFYPPFGSTCLGRTGEWQGSCHKKSVRSCPAAMYTKPLCDIFLFSLCEKLTSLSHSREWPLTPTSDEARALVCDRQMEPDGRVFERDVWLDGRTHVVRPAAASGRSTDKIMASGQIRPRPASPAASEEKFCLTDYAGRV